MTYLEKPLNECTPSERWKRKNREYFLMKMKERNIKWRKANPERIKYLNDLARKNNKEALNEYCRNYRKTHTDKRLNRLKEFSAKWRIENKEKIKIIDKVRHHNRRTIGGLTVNLIQEIYQDNIKLYGTLTCYLCLSPIEFGKDSLEHKIPVSRGGTNDRINLEIAHLSCNMKKGNKTHKEFLNKEV